MAFYELINHWPWTLNVVVVAYLVWNLWQKRRLHGARG
jgi:hypothetical protein